MRNVCFSILLLLFATGVAHGQVTEEQARKAAERAVQASAGYPSSKPLRVRRREDLEDDLFGFQIKVIGKIQKAAYFYEITPDGYFVISPTEALHVNSSHGRQFQLVAVSSRTGHAYLLWQSENAAAEFNKLIKDADVRVGRAVDAKLFTTFYFTLVADPLADSLIFSSWQLKLKVESYFFSDYEEARADRLFHKWWAGFMSAKLHFEFDPPASENALGYETKVAAISGSTERIPRLNEWTIQILFDGSCEVKKNRTMFPNVSKLGTMLSLIRP
jgi:hypothetical protein